MRRIVMIDQARGRGRAHGPAVLPTVVAIVLAGSWGLGCGTVARRAPAGTAPAGTAPAGTAPVTEGANMSDATSGAARVPDDFCIELSSGGGFTGAYQGTRVSADGKVVKWRTGPNAGPRKEEGIGTIDPAALSRLLQAVRASRFFDVSLDQPGNMTVVLSVTAGGRQHIVRYPLPMDQHPEAVRALVEELKREVRPLEQAHEGMR